NLLGKFSLEGIAPAPRGVPQIEVTFDIDANGILNVSAQDKSTGKQNQITITNDKGRLSKEDIDRMVNEAEKYKQQDDEQRKRINSKNSLESYIFNIKNSVEDNRVGSKISDADRTAVLNKCNETLTWLDKNQMAEVDEFEYQRQELEKVCMPIMSKIHQSGAPNNSGSSSEYSKKAENAGFGPTIEEVD
ncbi:Heat shock 70 kDa protein 1-like, partial [Trichoplax sp. H2]